MDDALYVLLQRIRKKPGLYLEKNWLIYLYYFIVGYTWRATEENSNYLYYFDEFNEFVYSYYGDQFINGRNWKGFILDHTNSQEEAFDKFYELLDQFLKERKNI